MFLKSKIYRDDILKILNISFSWEKLHEKSILISGATGLIGTMLVDVFMMYNQMYDAKIRVIALGRSEHKIKERFLDYISDKNFSYVIGDVNNPLYIENQVDYLFHCASNTHPFAYSTDPIGTIMTNVLGTNNLLSMAEKKKIERTVFFSTVEIYGENVAGLEKFHENDLGYIDCNTLRAGYPEGKRTGEALCQAYIHQYGMDIVIPRICRVFGPTMQISDTKALSQFINNAVKKENIVLKSRGLQYYSYCYVADVVSALLYIFFFGDKGSVYNVADPAFDIHLKDLALMLADIAETSVIFDVPDEVEAKGYSKATYAVLDAERLHSLGWKPSNTLYDSLSKTVEIMREKI